MKKATMFLVFVLLFSALAFAGGGTDAGSDVTNLVIWTQDTGQFTPKLEGWNKAYPNRSIKGNYSVVLSSKGKEYGP
jgi:ABC-type glycerol-3-phosphate transport system substrate-binding protein